MDREQHEQRAEELGDGEPLVEERPARQGGDDRAQQSQQRHPGDGQPGDAPEPEQVRDRRRGGEPHEPGEVAHREIRRASLDDERHRDQTDATGDELPGGERRHWHGLTPSLGEDGTGRHRDGAGETGEHADGVERGAGAKNEQRDTRDPEQPSEHDHHAQALPEQRHSEPGCDKGLDRSQGGGDASREAVGGDEEQDEEGADVEHAEHGGPGPPHAVWPPGCDQQEQQPGGQSAHGGGEHRAAWREQFGGHRVGHPPQDRGDHGGGDERGPSRRRRGPDGGRGLEGHQRVLR
jgi:hypothetical protein